VTLAPEAHHKALELTHRIAAAVEYWPTPDPTDIEGHREQRLDAYRRCATSCSRGFRRVFLPRGTARYSEPDVAAGRGRAGC